MIGRSCQRCHVRWAQDGELCRRCSREVGVSASVEAQRRHDARIEGLMKPAPPPPSRRRFIDKDAYGQVHICEVVWDGR